jgi:hypothetical protein
MFAALFSRCWTLRKSVLDVAKRLLLDAPRRWFPAFAGMMA